MMRTSHHGNDDGSTLLSALLVVCVLMVIFSYIVILPLAVMKSEGNLKIEITESIAIENETVTEHYSVR